MNEPISMWSGAIVWSQPCSRSTPWTVITFEPIPSIAAPIFTSMRARSCTCGSEAALRITRVAGRERGRHQRVLGRHHGRLVHQEVARREPARRRQQDVAVVLDARAERLERVEVRIEPAAADHVAAGRRHQRAAVAREQRAGEQEGGADALGQLAVDVGRGDPVGADRDVVLADPVGARAELAQQRRASPRTSAIRGTLRITTSSSVSSADARIGSAPFLLPAGTIVPDNGTPPWMTNFSMSEGLRGSGDAGQRSRRTPPALSPG